MVMKLINGHIRVETHAGSGGFGDVYRGYDERMERYVAIKIIDGICTSEKEVLRKLDHKGLPRLYDIYNDDNKTVLIMEWIEGINLEQYIADHGPVSEEEAIGIGVQLLDILEYLHGLSPAIVYQDLKPANIMITPSGFIKLVDFGTAIHLNYGDDVARLAGTVGYGSPEQRGLCGERRASVRSDIYSWGAVMYSLLSGQMLNKPPYTMTKIRYICPQISWGLSHVLSRATKRNESERYVNVAELKRALGSGSVVDVIYRCGYVLAAMIIVIPFILAWYAGIRGDAFTVWKGYIFSAWRMHELGGIYRFDEKTLKLTGYVLVTGAWMILGLRLMQHRKFLRIKKSVYLSTRKYSGLWVGTMMAGIIIGYGIWGDVNTLETYAAQKPLPVSICNANGDHVLVAYNAKYNLDGELRLCIDEDVINDVDGALITVVLTDKNTGIKQVRTIELN